jgi:hypothetical protein
MSTLIDLLVQARKARLILTHGEDDILRIRGPRSAEPLVRELLARKEQVLTTVAVYSGVVERLDWRKGRILDQPRPCVLCGRKTLLIEPYDGRPSHKSCAEAAIRWGTQPTGRADGGRAA